MSYAPCKNPSCKSYGEPHPNCRCYGGLAEGGDVRFCAADRAHQSGCEYFADGGMTEPPEGFEPVPDEHSSDAGSDEPPEGFEPVDDEGGVHAPALSEKPNQKLAETTPAQAFNEAVGQGLPIVGPLAAAAGRATAAGLNQITPDALLKPEWRGKGFGETYDALKANEGKSAEEHPIASTAGNVMGNVVAFGPAEKAAAAAAEFARLGKVGSSLVKGMIANGIVQGENEVSKWMLGEADPTHPVGAALAHMGGAAFAGGLLGGAGSSAAVGLKKMAESKAAGKLAAFVSGLASAAEHPLPEKNAIGPHTREVVDAAMQDLHIGGIQPYGSTMKAYQAGQKAFDKGIGALGKGMAQGAGTIIGGSIGGTTGALAGAGLTRALAEPIAEMVSGLARPYAKKYAVPVVLKILSGGNTSGLLEALGHAENVAAGEAAASKAVQSILDTSVMAGTIKGGSAAGQIALDKYIEKGGIGQELQEASYNKAVPDEFTVADPVVMYAKGGEVKKPDQPTSTGPGIQENNGLAIHYPDQNILLQAARGRISNYLGSLRPQENQPRLAFDEPPDLREKKRSYHKALDIAVKPLSIMDEIKRGTLESEHVKHFNAMHPELGSLLQKKITEGIVKSQLDGKKPPFKVRQSLSMFMGTALSAEFTPQSIQAAQMTFAKNGQEPQPQGGGSAPKKSTASLTKSDQAFLTGSQARQKRMNRPS